MPSIFFILITILVNLSIIFLLFLGVQVLFKEKDLIFHFLKKLAK